MEIVREYNKVYVLNDKKEEVAYITFPNIDENTVLIDHTFVSESLRGLGIASMLMEAAYEQISQTKRKATPECEYAKVWFEKHPEKRHIIL